MKILVINAGSSSVKYQLFDMTNETVLAKGICERIGNPVTGIFKHKVPGREDYKVEVPLKTHSEAIQLIVDTLVSEKLGVIKSMKEIDAVGHRVLHGGEKFSGSVLIDENVIKAIEDCCELGPLHNPHNLTGIHACEEIIGNVPQVAVFDTGFHQTMPDYAYMYALPYEYYEKYKIRRYGFHGTSHRYVSMRAADMLSSLGKKPEDLKIITCHLGNGSSITAIKDGRVIDTSMGFTPQEGVCMGTRSGSIDATIVPYIAAKENLTPAECEKMLNKKSGLLGISGASSDCRDIEDAAANGDVRASLALNVLCYGIKKIVGSYTAALGGVDLIIFTGGIGENSASTRFGVCQGLEYLGVDFDKDVNETIHGKDAFISKPSSKVKVCVIPTNEELVIARDTMNIVKNLK